MIIFGGFGMGKIAYNMLIDRIKSDVAFIYRDGNYRFFPSPLLIFFFVSFHTLSENIYF